MFKGKKERQRGQRSNANLPQFGVFDIPDIDSLGAGNVPQDDDEDDDLEAELMALMAGGPTPKAPPRTKQVKPPPSNLDMMFDASMKDVEEDEDISSGDENDPELLAELQVVTGEVKRLSPVPPPMAAAAASSAASQSKSDIESLLNERINNYREAEAKAKAVGDTAKSRRLGRGLKTLGDLLKKAQNGMVINEDDIPLPVALGGRKPETPNDTPSSVDSTQVLRPAPPPPAPAEEAAAQPDILDAGAISEPEPGSSKQEENSEKIKTLTILRARRDEYKKAALLAKRSGDVKKALEHIKIIKQFEVVLAGVEAGQPADLSAMPPSPFLDEVVQRPPPQISQPLVSIQLEKGADVDETPATEPEPLLEEPKEPLTVLDALEQRLAKFKEQEETGKKDGNSSKARRMGRIVKQYQDAIKLHKAGKPFPVDELPTPPGFAPIPVEGYKNPQPPAPTSPENVPLINIDPDQGGISEEAISPEQPPRSPLPPRSPVAPHRSPIAPHRSPLVSPEAPTLQGKKVVTRQEKQLAILLTRQKQYKEAALKAKTKGDIQQAKEFLRLVKGFDPLIEASKNGLPIDMNSIPVAPSSKKEIQEDSGFSVVTVADCLPGSDSEIYERLLNDLQSQFKLCIETRNHFKSMGDIANANKFDHLAVHSKKDLDTVRASQSRGDPVPRFHYEKRSFSIVRCNVDLGDNDLELSIIQGVNYNVPNPKEVDTYVRFEFPGLNDETRKDKTNIIYNTNNPSYNAVFNIPIQRSVRAFQRLFKRHSIKCEIWAKGGFLRSDILVGTVNVKLQQLEVKCTIHDSFDLMDGRKVVGGKLEVKVRVRHPIQAKQIEQVEEKWLVVL